MDNLVDKRKQAIEVQIQEKMGMLEEIDTLLEILKESEGPKDVEIKRDLNSVLSEDFDDIDEITGLMQDIRELKEKRNRYIEEADNRAHSQHSYSESKSAKRRRIRKRKRERSYSEDRKRKRRKR